MSREDEKGSKETVQENKTDPKIEDLGHSPTRARVDWVGLPSPNYLIGVYHSKTKVKSFDVPSFITFFPKSTCYNLVIENHRIYGGKTNSKQS